MFVGCKMYLSSAQLATRGRILLDLVDCGAWFSPFHDSCALSEHVAAAYGYG